MVESNWENYPILTSDLHRFLHVKHTFPWVYIYILNIHKTKKIKYIKAWSTNCLYWNHPTCFWKGRVQGYNTDIQSESCGQSLRGMNVLGVILIHLSAESPPSGSFTVLNVVFQTQPALHNQRSARWVWLTISAIAPIATKLQPTLLKICQCAHAAPGPSGKVQHRLFLPTWALGTSIPFPPLSCPTKHIWSMSDFPGVLLWLREQFSEPADSCWRFKIGISYICGWETCSRTDDESLCLLKTPDQL